MRTPRMIASMGVALVLAAATAGGASAATSSAPTESAATSAAQDATGTYFPLTNARLLDTRTTNGGHLGTINGGLANKFDLTVAGRGGVPASRHLGRRAQRHRGGAHQERPTSRSIPRARPCPPRRPSTSTPGGPAPTSSPSRSARTARSRSTTTPGPVHVVVDVLGFYAASASHHARWAASSSPSNRPGCSTAASTVARSSPVRRWCSAPTSTRPPTPSSRRWR